VSLLQATSSLSQHSNIQLGHPRILLTVRCFRVLPSPAWPSIGSTWVPAATILSQKPTITLLTILADTTTSSSSSLSGTPALESPAYCCDLLMTHTRRATFQLSVLTLYVCDSSFLSAAADNQAENPDDRVRWQDCEAANCKGSTVLLRNGTRLLTRYSGTLLDKNVSEQSLHPTTEALMAFASFTMLRIWTHSTMLSNGSKRSTDMPQKVSINCS
jgi:hypothetical protein